MRVGVFGGTFDPPHLGHLVAAQDALEQLSLECVLFVPAAQPPHKRDRTVSDSGHRLAMLHLALADDPRFAIEPLELERAGVSYTVDTLRALDARGDAPRLVLLLGADQYAEFASWREPAEIRRLAEIAVLHRAGTELEAQHAQPGVHDVAVTRVDISSTLIRGRVAAGASIRYLVPPGVADYIAAHSLYRPAEPRNGAPAQG